MNIRMIMKIHRAMNRKPLREGNIPPHEPARWIGTLAARSETVNIKPGMGKNGS